MFGLVNTGPVSPSTDLLMMYRVCSVQIEYVQLPDRYDRTELSRFGSFSYRTGMIGPNCLGSVPWGPNLLGSVQREPNSVRSRLNVLFPQLGSDRTETQVLEVLNANSNRTELDERAVQQFFRPVQS